MLVSMCVRLCTCAWEYCASVCMCNTCIVINICFSEKMSLFFISFQCNAMIIMARDLRVLQKLLLLHHQTSQWHYLTTCRLHISVAGQSLFVYYYRLKLMISASSSSCIITVNDSSYCC